MGERLVPKLDRIGAEAGIKQMTPETKCLPITLPFAVYLVQKPTHGSGLRNWMSRTCIKALKITLWSK